MTSPHAFSMQMTTQQQQQQQQGIDFTVNHLANSLLSTTEPNQSNINNNNNNNVSNAPFTFGNISGISGIQPTEQELSEKSLAEMKKSTKLLQEICGKLTSLPTMSVADKLRDKGLKQYFKEYNDAKKNVHELEKLTYKIKLYASAGFIPKHERLSVSLDSKKIRAKTKYNYMYIQQVLNESVKLSKTGYHDLLMEKQTKLKHNKSVVDIIKKIHEEQILEKTRKLKRNEFQFNSQTIKCAILNNYKSEVNKLNLMKMETDEYYNDELIKYQNKTILSFEKLTQKIGLAIGSNEEINHDFNADLNRAREQRQANKIRNYQNEYRENKMEQDDDDAEAENDEWIWIGKNQKVKKSMYKPALCKFNQFNHINVNHQQRQQIVKNFGNIHDQIQLSLYQKQNPPFDSRLEQKPKKYNRNKKRKYRYSAKNYQNQRRDF